MGSKERPPSPLLPAWGRVCRACFDLSTPSERQLIKGLLRKSKEFKSAKVTPPHLKNHATKGKENAPAEQSNLTLRPAAGQPQTPMTKHTGFRRAYSLRVPKAPGLLDHVPGSSYGCLEEAPLPWEAEEAPWRADGSLGHGQERARKKGSCRHQALSLKAQSLKEEEATPAGEASDGQLLIGQTHGKGQASNRVKRCQKVNRTLQRGWQSFLANVFRLTLMHSASQPTHRW